MIIGGYTVISKKDSLRYEVICNSCKKKFIRYISNLKRNSNGCDRCAKAKDKYCEDAKHKDTHVTWENMCNRMRKGNKQNHITYRDKTISNSWLGKGGFWNFVKDVGLRPSKNHSIDRIDNNKGYSKENCRWATKKEQQNNMSTNRKLIYKNKIYSISDLAKKLGITYGTCCYRARNGKLKTKE